MLNSDREMCKCSQHNAQCTEHIKSDVETLHVRIHRVVTMGRGSWYQWGLFDEARRNCSCFGLNGPLPSDGEECF